MSGGRGQRKVCDLLGLADIDAVRRDLALRHFGDLGGNRLQAGLVANCQREVAAAHREVQRPRPADAARGSRHRSSGSLDRGHDGSIPTENCAESADFRVLSRFPKSFMSGTEQFDGSVLIPITALNETPFAGSRAMVQSNSFRAAALIVEDDPSQRAMISLLLEESDYA